MKVLAPDPARKKRRYPRFAKARRTYRRYAPKFRRGYRRAAKYGPWLKPILTGIGAARVAEKASDMIGLSGVNLIIKPGAAYLGGKWKGLVGELVYELLDERNDDIWSLLGIKFPGLGGTTGGGV